MCGAAGAENVVGCSWYDTLSAKDLRPSVIAVSTVGQTPFETHCSRFRFASSRSRFSFMFSKANSFRFAFASCRSRRIAANASVEGRFVSVNIPSSSVLKA